MVACTFPTRRHRRCAALGFCGAGRRFGGRRGADLYRDSISQAAQDARRDVGRLTRRADNLLRLTVADGPERGGAAVRRFRAEQAPLAHELAAVFNGRVSEDDWLLIVPTRELDLVLTMQPLVIRLAPTSKRSKPHSSSRSRRSSRRPTPRPRMCCWRSR